MTTPLIIKLGGVLLDNKEAMERLFQALVVYRQQHQRPLIIVHGGGCLVDNLMKQLGMEVVKQAGLRVTPAEHIEVVTGILAGTANKLLLACARSHQLPAVGLSLGDSDMISIHQLSPELGHVGRAEGGTAQLLTLLLTQGYLPIVSSIGITEQGELMNVNGDQAATALAEVLSADLIFLSDVSGILDGKGQRIEQLSVEQAEQLISQGIITDGMVVKVQAALQAAQKLGRPVDIASWRQAEKLVQLFNGSSVGTRIQA